MKRIMVSFVIVILGLSYAAFAENWNHNNYPIRNFSFELYSEETGSFDNWVYGNEETMHPEDFGQDLAYSLHYSASAYIKETAIGEGHESCYLQTTLTAAPTNDRFHGKPCYLVAFIKCKNVESTNGGGAFAEISFPPGDFEITYTSQMLTGDRNWCKLIVPFTFPSMGDFYVNVGLRDAIGEVWIDYVQIVQMETYPEGGVFTNLDNPSFDRDPYNFNGWDENPGDDTTITADANISMNGPNSAKFYFTGVLPPNNRTSFLYQNINTTSGPYTYCASAFVKTESLQYEQSPLHPGAKIHVLYEDKLDWYSRSVTGTNTWIKIQGVFDKPRGTSDSLELRLETLASSGTAWFDWVALKLNPIQNPHFNDWSRTEEEPHLVKWGLEGLEGDGEGGYTTEESHSSPSCGYVANESIDYDTVLEQWLCEGVSPSLREGGTYLLTGWIKTVGVLPNEISPGGDPYPNGAFVQIVADSSAPGYEEIELVRTECLTGSNDWQKFSLWFSLPLDYFMDENDGLTTFDYFDIRCCLHYASGTAYFDDINITELESIADIATVVPQPQAVEYWGYHSDPLVTFDGGIDAVTIYYTPDDHPHVLLGDTNEFSAENLRQELNRAFYECEEDNGEYEYPITESQIVALFSNLIASELNKPCIVIGDPEWDYSVNHLFQAELEKRGIVLPENFNSEGYMMDIGEDVILIAASDHDGAGLTRGAGSFYGTQTLLQLLDIRYRSGEEEEEGDYTYHPNTVVAPASYIYDFPDLPWRGQVYIDIPIVGGTGDSPDDVLTYHFDENRGDGEEYYAQNERDLAFLSALKVNRIIIETGVYYYQYGETTEQQNNYNDYWAKMADLFDFCRKRHMEPIPVLQSGGHSRHIIYWRPWFAECMWIGGVDIRPGGAGDPYPDVLEDHEFENGSFTLDKSNVFDLAGETEIRLFTYDEVAEEYVEHERDVAWEIDESYVEPFYSYSSGFDPEKGRVTINRIDGGGIEEDDIVYVSYNAIWPEMNGRKCLAYCTAAGGLYEFMEDVIDTTIEELNPRYINLGHDEVYQYHTDERDRDEDFEDDLLGSIAIDMPARLLATDLDKLIYIVKDRLNPPQVIVYGDLLHEKHRGEFFCQTDVWYYLNARPCDMGGVDEWVDGEPKGKTWLACDLLHGAGRDDIIIEDWTGSTWIIGFEGDPPQPKYAQDYIGELIDWRLESGFSTIGTGYNGYVGHATATFRVDYEINPEEIISEEVSFTRSLKLDKDSWYESGTKPYMTKQLTISTEFPIHGAIVTVRMNDYIFGSVWFDSLFLHEVGGVTNLLSNPGFNEPGTGDQTFAHWEDSIVHEGIDHVVRDEDIKFEGASSCKLIRTQCPPIPVSNFFVLQGYSEFSEPLQPGEEYILEGYMRGERIENFAFENCYNWTHETYERYAEGEDCEGVVYWEGYSWGFPGVVHDWLWSIDHPYNWLEHYYAMAYLKIGHIYAPPYLGYQPMDDLYPYEPDKGVE